jgi:hypothetical protein
VKRTISTLVVLGLLLAVSGPTPVSAHQGNPNFRSEFTTVKPAAAGDGLQIRMQNFDDHVELVNRTGKVVVVKGYDGEPYVRLSPSGLVEVNLNSPAFYLNRDRFADVAVPDRADADAAPDWKEVDESGVYNWHDHRTHYMGRGTPPQVGDESTETPVFNYSVPLEVGGKAARANGTLTWVGSDSGFPVLPFAGLALVAIAGLTYLAIRRRRRIDSGDDPGPA